MISIMIYDKKPDETSLLKKMASDIVAELSDERCDFTLLSESPDYESWIKEKKLLDCACMDVSLNDGIRRAEDLRKNYPLAGIMIVAESGISPVRYMKPSIMASSLILRPIDHEEARITVREWIDTILGTEKDEEKLMTLETKDGITKLPYSKICYVEARMKKIFIRLENEEYGCYDTLDHMVEALPEEFVRCHRGFIVNSKMVSKVDLSQNILSLSNGMVVPLSRSYKSSIKELYHE